MPPTQNNDLRTRLFSKFPKKIGPTLIGYSQNFEFTTRNFEFKVEIRSKL